MRRVEAVDLARLVALLGMMLTHLGPRWSGYAEPPLSEVLAGGRAAPLFALLAGVSLGLVGRSRLGGLAVAPTVGRAVCLLTAGLALASLPDLQILVVLPVYAVLIVAVLPLRSMDAKPLLWLGAVWCVAGPVVLLGLRRMIDRPERSALQLSFADPAGLAGLPVDLLLWGPYPAVVWVAYVVVGLGLSRLDLTSASTGRRLLAVGALVAASCVWLGLVLVDAGAVTDRLGPGQWWHVVIGPGRLDPTDPGVLLVAGQHTSTPLNVLGATGSAVAVLGLAVLVQRRPGAQRVTRPLVIAGSMTLTLYVVHVVLVWGHDRHGWSIVGQTYGEWLAQSLALVAGAVAWRSFARRGPLEGTVHAVTAWGRPRATTTTAPPPGG